MNNNGQIQIFFLLRMVLMHFYIISWLTIITEWHFKVIVALKLQFSHFLVNFDCQNLAKYLFLILYSTLKSLNDIIIERKIILCVEKSPIRLKIKKNQPNWRFPEKQGKFSLMVLVVDFVPYATWSPSLAIC